MFVQLKMYHVTRVFLKQKNVNNLNIQKHYQKKLLTIIEKSNGNFGENTGNKEVYNSSNCYFNLKGINENKVVLDTTADDNAAQNIGSHVV